MTLLEKIPTVLTVAVLVGIFLALKRHSHSARLQLWMVAWLLIFTHFAAQYPRKSADPIKSFACGGKIPIRQPNFGDSALN